MLTLAEIFENATPEPNTGCLLWLGPVDQDGYATTGSGRRSRNVRVTRLVLGLTDPKIYACHGCDQPGCIEPRHLFAGSSADNQRDSNAKRRGKNSKKTHCRGGHPYDDVNTYRLGGRWRVCRTCQRANVARYLARKKAAAEAATRGGAHVAAQSD